MAGVEVLLTGGIVLGCSVMAGVVVSMLCAMSDGWVGDEVAIWVLDVCSENHFCVLSRAACSLSRSSVFDYIICVGDVQTGG